MTWRLLTAIAFIACQGATDGRPGNNATPLGVDTGTVTEPLFLIQWDAVDDPPLPHGKQFEVRFNRPAFLHIKCRGESDGEEEHLWWSQQQLDLHEVALYGLLSDIRYDCSFEGTDGTVVANITHRTTYTGPMPDEIPDMTVGDWDRDRSWGAYTLFSHWNVNTSPRQQKFLLVDPDGQVRWHYLLEASATAGIEVAYVGDGLILAAGGKGYNPTLIDLAGELVYKGPDPESGGEFHHDTAMLPSGDILSLASSFEQGPYSDWLGALLEVRTPFTDELVWTWDSQAAFDAGQLPGGGEGNADPYHTNAVKFLDDADGPAAYLSMKGLDQIVRVDRTTGDVTWHLGPGADFTLIGDDGEPLDDDTQWFWGQHDPQYRLPRMLVYDNGIGRGADHHYSRAVEYELDLEAKTARVVWEYLEDGWYEPFWGGVDLLDNDNVLIAIGHCWDCNADSGGLDRNSAVVEVEPATNDVVWRLTIDDPKQGVYRADRLDGCEIFLNGKYCDTLAENATF